MIVQFGYVSSCFRGGRVVLALDRAHQSRQVFLFGWSWPLAALCALLNNLTELRTDCFKLCMVMRKPPARQANSIGVWYYALEAITVGAVLTNTAFMFVRICQQGLDPHASPFLQLVPVGYGIGAQLGLVVIFEHLILFSKFGLDYMIPDVPSDIRDQIRRQQVDLAREQARQLKEAASSVLSSRESISSVKSPNPIQSPL